MLAGEFRLLGLRLTASPNDRQDASKIIIRPEEVAGPAAHQLPLADNHPTEVWWTGGASFLIATVLAAVVVMALKAQCRSDAAPAPHHLSPAGRATLNYWNQLRKISAALDGEASETDPATPAEYTRQLQMQRAQISEATRRISALPVLDVDSDAIEVGVQLTQLCGEMQVLFSGLE